LALRAEPCRRRQGDQKPCTRTALGSHHGRGRCGSSALLPIRGCGPVATRNRTPTEIHHAAHPSQIPSPEVPPGFGKGVPFISVGTPFESRHNVSVPNWICIVVAQML